MSLIGRSSFGNIRLNFPVMPKGIEDLTKITTKEGVEDVSEKALDAFGQLVTPVIEKGQQLLQPVTDAIDTTAEKVETTLKPIGEALEPITEPIGEALQTITENPLVQQMGESFQGTLDIFNQDPTQVVTEQLGEWTDMPKTMALLGMFAPDGIPGPPIKAGARATGLVPVQGPFPRWSQLEWNKRGGVSVKGPDGKVRKADPLAVEVAAYEALGGDMSQLVNRAYTQGMATPSASQIAQYQKRYGLSKKTATHAHHILEHSLFGNAVGQMKNQGRALADLQKAGFLPGNTAWQMLDVPGGFKGSSHQGWFHSKQMNSLPARGTLQRKLANGEFAKMRYKDQLDLLKRTAGEAELTAVFWVRWKEATMMARNPQFATLVNNVNKSRSKASIKALREYLEQNKDVMRLGTGEQPPVQEVINAIYKKNQPMANPQLKSNMYTSLAQQVTFNTKIRNKPGMIGLERYLPLERNQ